MNAAASPAVRITPKLILGLGILALGLLWTLDNLDILESERLTEWWPAVLILVGAVRLLNPDVSKVGSAVLIILGTGLLLDSLDVWNFDVGDLIPLGIAVIGGKLAWDALVRRERPRAVDDPAADVHAFALMAGVRRQSTSHEFRYADANAIMGGVELDLREAQMKDGETATIDAFALWGGVEMTVPENWRVVGKVLPLMGAFEDNTKNKTGTGPVLIVRGTAIMGGIEVKN
jgi:hypothetical protein